MELKDRVREARKKKGLSQARLAELVGVSQPTIMHIESGRNQSSTKIIDIARALGVSPEWLQHGIEGITPIESQLPQDAEIESFNVMGLDTWDDETPLDSDEVEIPYLKDVRLSAGNGCFALDDFSGRKLRFSKRTLKDKGIDVSNAVCVTASGDSMEPAIPDGCTVAVDMSCKDIKDGQIYAINNDGLLQIKLLRWVSGTQISIESYNPSYAPIVKELKDIGIIGRVFWYSVLL